MAKAVFGYWSLVIGSWWSVSGFGTRCAAVFGSYNALAKAKMKSDKRLGLTI
jgi:hypothetical protein